MSDMSYFSTLPLWAWPVYGKSDSEYSTSQSKDVDKTKHQGQNHAQIQSEMYEKARLKREAEAGRGVGNETTQKLKYPSESRPAKALDIASSVVVHP